MIRTVVLAVVTVLAALPAIARAQTFAFGGYDWYARSGTGGPGPNTFSSDNVSVDANGWLHLRIAHVHNAWTTAEVFSAARLGFGTYEFQIVGRPDLLDDNVVLGLFNYPTADVGPDATNEIDIEFATWGGSQPEHGNWTVWPAIAQAGLGPTTHAYATSLAGDTSTHRFTWTPTRVDYVSLQGLVDDDSGSYATWTFAPPDAAQRIPQQALPVHMNLWLLGGNAPTDRQDVDIAIARFRFIPDCLFGDGFDGSGSCPAN